MNNAAITVTIGKFRSEYTQKRFTEECHNFIEHTCGYPVSDLNDRSWDDCYNFLSKYLPTENQYQNFHIVFEFLMPDSLKRVDVLLLTQNKVVALEFKEKREIRKNDIAQVAGYRQSISHYHYLTEENDMTVSAYLVYTPGDPNGRHDLVDVLHPKNFTQTLKKCLSGETPMSKIACDQWVASPFHPLKNIAEATLQLFRDGDLPNIKSIHEGDIKDTLDYIYHVIDNPDRQKNILFVSGVPGAGKTLVGLKTVYDHGRPDEKFNPIYLSGNDPLINILQNTLSVNHLDLEGSSYIQSMKNYKRRVGDSTPPLNNIIVFDEAQRAWDMDRMEPGQTEATLLLRIGDRIAECYGKVTIICLIGDGQAIHKNEETGMTLWIDALADPDRGDWHVYVPENYGSLFRGTPNFRIASELMLNISIRHDFIDVSPWIEAILDLDLNSARSIYQEMLKKGFQCWRFRDKAKLPDLVQYIQNNFPGSHTGIVVSSHMKGQSYFGPQYRGSYIKAGEAYSWYMNEGPQLTRGATEFLIQGIELEYPIIAFVGDYYIQNGRWVLDQGAYFDREIRDRNTIIRNVYRVLLTRSRKGIFLYFPQDPKLDETYQWFVSMLQI